MGRRSKEGFYSVRRIGRERERSQRFKERDAERDRERREMKLISLRTFGISMSEGALQSLHYAVTDDLL